MNEVITSGLAPHAPIKDPIDRHATVSTCGPVTEAPATVRDVPLYVKRKKIYQREVQGPFQTLRAVTLVILAGFYLVLPWINTRGRQAVWFDLPERKFHLFSITFWPQEFFYLSWLMIIGAMALLFFTTLAGRLWCGYACPQTVWTKLYMWIEWLTEGNRTARMRRDRGPWTLEKAARVAAKHILWLVVAFVVGITFVGYFVPIRDLLARDVGTNLSLTEGIAVAIASLALYADAGAAREQICLYACPYARFQGAMVDAATLNVVYDSARGEPRGYRSRHHDVRTAGKGDCVDCNLCVDVCPTGIDIRNGTQYECIGCAACIDACNQVMRKVGYAPGLIRYATEKAIAGERYKILRPRLLGYGGVTAVMVIAFTYGLAHRVPLRLDIIRDRARLYREISEGVIENVYTLKILNLDQQAHTYRISASANESLHLVGPQDVHVRSGEILDVPVRIQGEEAHEYDDGHGTPQSVPVRFSLRASDDPGLTVTETSRFIRPRAGSD